MALDEQQLTTQSLSYVGRTVRNPTAGLVGFQNNDPEIGLGEAIAAFGLVNTFRLFRFFREEDYYTLRLRETSTSESHVAHSLHGWGPYTTVMVQQAPIGPGHHVEYEFIAETIDSEERHLPREGQEDDEDEEAWDELFDYAAASRREQQQ
ncbi:unnamed protein product [Discula destructiva]